MALVHNTARLKPCRRELRGRLTIAEARLWNHLKGRSLWGRKFRRQHSVGPYVLDFYCPGERLALELDGAAHDHEAAQDRDAIRTRFLDHPGGLRPPPLLIRGGEGRVVMLIFPSSLEEGCPRSGRGGRVSSFTGKNGRVKKLVLASS